MDSINTDMDIVYILITIILNYAIFKLGEHYAYFKIARGLKNLKDHADALNATRANGVMEVEKIGEQYYAYVDNKFIGQGSSLDEVKELVTTVVKNDPGRYTSMMIKMKE